MPGKNPIHIGTSGWSYAHWKGTFYPEGAAADQFLTFYAQKFRTVEINNTFYQLPSEEAVKLWRETTSKDFIFAVKASRYITHMKKLKDPQEGLEKFIRAIEPLGSRLGPILFQLPPRWRANRERFAGFIAMLPDRLRYAFEFRDPTWFNRDIYDLMRQNNIAFCMYELAGNYLAQGSHRGFRVRASARPGRRVPGFLLHPSPGRLGGSFFKLDETGKGNLLLFRQ